jgi:hypothetical protein
MNLPSRSAYNADFSNYTVPAGLASRFTFDPENSSISFRGKMSLGELNILLGEASTEDQRWALKKLHLESDWYEGVLKPLAIDPIKKLRSWCFVICFLCIGLSTRFKDLATFGLKPFWAFTIGVLVNVPLGFFLSTYVFVEFWNTIR